MKMLALGFVEAMGIFAAHAGPFFDPESQGLSFLPELCLWGRACGGLRQQKIRWVEVRAEVKAPSTPAPSQPERRAMEAVSGRFFCELSCGYRRTPGVSEKNRMGLPSVGGRESMVGFLSVAQA